MMEPNITDRDALIEENANLRASIERIRELVLEEFDRFHPDARAELDTLFRLATQK